MSFEREQIRRARELRRNMTPAEVILWRELRGRKFVGYKFRRQRPIGPYIVDFYCHRSSLIVELDGESHDGREEYDANRQTELNRLGFKVLRFWNPDVYDNLDGVLEVILQECARRVPTSQIESERSSYPSPGFAGEGLG